MGASYRFDDNGRELLPVSKTVSQVNEYIKLLIEEEIQLQDLYISAEISNFKHHSVGHMYFTLKDENSEIRAVMFRSYASRLNFRVENGMKVLVHARVGVYEKAGSYQLYVDSMQPDGIGSLYLAFEQLKERLMKEGLFDESHKKPLPKFPKRIGVVTSPTGAAVRDIIKVAKNRCPFINILLYPSAVQGKDAPYELTQAIEHFNLLDSVDVIIIGRGGGSIEDLWGFNDEGLARAIYNSHIPVVSAVGHEIDFTICDFVADVRAATPSHGAELVTPNCIELKNKVCNLYLNMKNNILFTISDYRNLINGYMSSGALKNPMAMFDQKKMRLITSSDRLYSSMDLKNRECRGDVQRISAQLTALNPLAVLSRGYGAVFSNNGNVIKSIEQVNKGEIITVKISDGDITAEIIKKQGKGDINA
ncbi:MAG: exodeoxyribonuclease VII large subunit [Clostridia bacterium]|nr:exodeoxyribonuclease VII large subunit [Clostridia bacterium]